MTCLIQSTYSYSAASFAVRMSTQPRLDLNVARGHGTALCQPLLSLMSIAVCLPQVSLQTINNASKACCHVGFPTYRCPKLGRSCSIADSEVRSFADAEFVCLPILRCQRSMHSTYSTVLHSVVSPAQSSACLFTPGVSIFIRKNGRCGTLWA